VVVHARQTRLKAHVITQISLATASGGNSQKSASYQTCYIDNRADFGELLPVATPATNATVRVEGEGRGAMGARKQEERIASIKVLTAGQGGGEENKLQGPQEEGDTETETEEEEAEKEVSQGKKEHGKGGVSARPDKSKIKKTKQPSKCPHQRRRSRCKDCGGAGLCPHQRQRSSCKECGGSNICPHQRIRSICKECGGSSICPHQRRRSRCKECGGSSICPHQRIRSTCKECGAERK
jgi:hypothetical protein